MNVKGQVLAALDAAGGVPWWDEALCHFVAYAGCRPPENGCDQWGQASASAAGTGTSEPCARSAAELLKRQFPNGKDPLPFSGLSAALDPGVSLAVGLHPLGPFDRLSTLLGASEALAALLDEPIAARSVLDRIADYHLAIARNYLKIGLEAAWLADDYAGSAGPLLRPSLWRQMILPGLARVVAAYRQAGALVFFHTCGLADAFLPDLLDAGVTAFNLEAAVCDLLGLKKLYGRRIAFVSAAPSLHLALHGTF